MKVSVAVLLPYCLGWSLWAALQLPRVKRQKRRRTLWLCISVTLSLPVLAVFEVMMEERRSLVYSSSYLTLGCPLLLLQPLFRLSEWLFPRPLHWQHPLYFISCLLSPYFCQFPNGTSDPRLIAYIRDCLVLDDRCMIFLPYWTY